MTVPAPAPSLADGWWGSRVGGLPPAFWALWVGTLVNRLGAFVSPFPSLSLPGPRGSPIALAGLVLTVLGVGLGISQPLGGILADRYGRRRTLVLGLTGS